MMKTMKKKMRKKKRKKKMETGFLAFQKAGLLLLHQRPKQ